MCEIATSIDESMKILGRDYAQNEQSYVQFAKARRWRNVPYEPEDIVQIVFVRVAANIAVGDCCLVEFDGVHWVKQSKPKVKLTEIQVFIRGKIIFLWQELYQREFVRRKPTASLAAGDLNIESMEPLQSQAAEDGEVNRALLDCISQLSEDSGKLIKLKFFEGMTYPAIGGLTKQSKDQVARSIARALNQLRKCLESKQSR